MTLIKSLARPDKRLSFSYDNLIGNFKDGEIGTKIRNQIINDYLVLNNPDKVFNEEFYRYTFTFVNFIFCVVMMGSISSKIDLSILNLMLWVFIQLPCIRRMLHQANQLHMLIGRRIHRRLRTLCLGLSRQST